MDEQRLQGIGQLLILEKLIDQTKAMEYYKLAAQEKISLLHYLVKNTILSAEQIALTAAQSFGVPLLDITCIDINGLPINLVNEKLIRRHAMIPLYTRGNNLYLATDDPSKHDSLKEIQFHTGLNTHAIVVGTDKLHAFILHLFYEKENQTLAYLSDDSSDFNKTELSLPDEEQECDPKPSVTDNDPVVKLVNKMLIDAIKQGASDVHFEPYEKEYRIRYRQDGILHEIATPPYHLAAQVTARIKVLAQLDSSERRIPQDGGFKMTLSKSRSIDFRVSTCPTSGGEKVVIRILDTRSAKLDIDMLGFSAIQKRDFVKALEKPQGMILVTGPTGSGKTVSLYTALHLLNTKEVNISTAEDPVEIKVSGINQVQINPKVGLTFSEALRSFLRQDPDIIMVGEIRDLETADIAIKAAQTGHLVLSTLHTKSAAETLNRLVTMGIPSFNIVSSVTLIIAQRLARKLCDQCKLIREDYTPTSLMELGFKLEDLATIPIYKAVGCSACAQGYKGRIGLFEVVPMSQSLGQSILSGGNSQDLLKIAQSEGMLTLFQSGLEKIKMGLTTIEEVNRVTVE